MKYREEYDNNILGRNLRRLRVANSLSVEQVQEYLRLSTPQAVYNYEEGTRIPPGDNLIALMELYGAEVTDLVCNPDEESECKDTVSDTYDAYAMYKKLKKEDRKLHYARLLRVYY